MSTSERRGSCARCGAPDSPERAEINVYMCDACFRVWLAGRKPVRQLYGELRARVPNTLGGG